MDCIIPEKTLQSAQLSADELKQEVAVLLFEQERLTLGQASRLAGMDQLAFQRLLGRRKISPHYDAEDLEEDLKALREK